jgi:TatD DNase family protein
MSQFESDRTEMLARATDSGLKLINTIGIDVDSCRKAIALAEKYPFIVASVGIHPGDAKKAKKEDILQLEDMASHPKVVAIGELGLDFYHDASSKDIQLEVLGWELELAQKVGLPIIIHCREAQEAMLPVLKKWASSYPLPGGKPRGVLHCFGGDLETAQAYIEMGFYIALGAYLGYPSSAKLRETVKSIPNERLVVETDCPFLPPQKFRGQRNEPSYILFTLGVLAELKDVSVEKMAAQTTQNAMQLFGLNRFG